MSNDFPSIERFGLREWRAVVLTNEVHGHLGIYSTLGVKMGLRALEELDALGLKGPVSIVSHAGLVPPVSCLNDGLQIGTGSTLGHGLISAPATATPSASADFTCGGRTIRLSLREEFDLRIREDIQRATAQFGRTPQYWQTVRELALKYWAEWDRAEIFSISTCL